MSGDDLWRFLPVGYLLTVLIEAPILLFALSPRHPVGRRMFAGLWLTACTYPVVVIVMPSLFEVRWLYLIVAETFAPLAECLLFRAAFLGDLPPDRRQSLRDYAAIVAANLASFGVGELMRVAGAWEALGWG